MSTCVCGFNIGTLSACPSCGRGFSAAPRRRPPYQRTSATSRAGAAVAATKAPSQRDVIVGWVRQHGAATRQEITAGTGYEINVVTARVNAECGPGGRLQRGASRVCRVTGHVAQTVEVRA